MPRSLPSLPVAVFALKRRLLGLFGLNADAFAGAPEGLHFSPSLRHFAAYDAAPLALRFATSGVQDAVRWQAEARAKLTELTGCSRPLETPRPLHMDDFPLDGGMTRRRVYLRCGPAVDIPVHLISAGPAAAPRPVMICLQGTNTGAHLSWGEVKFPDDLDKRKRGYDIALQAAQRGYLAVAIEQSCFGERAEHVIDPRSAVPCVDATMHAFLLGRTLIGERCADVSAVIDWLVARSGEFGIDTARIHIMGHSSGGSSAYYAAALDERIGAVLACGCLGFIRETIGRRRENQGQEVIPGILDWLETADIIGLIAPRPFVTVAGDSDHIWPSKGALAVVAEARAIYERLRAPGLIACVTAPGGHSFRPDPSWSAFMSTLSRQSP